MRQQRLVLVVAILASFVAFLDGSVVTVALPSIAAELGGGLALQQWVVNAYLITLGSLMLLAGSLSDLFGRKRILAIGLAGFACTATLCAVAPDGGFLVGARALQGAAGALLIPSSLAIIISSFAREQQGKAIGTWTAWTGIAFVVAPVLGGFLIDMASWRFIFALYVPPIIVTLWLLKKLRVTEPARVHSRIDILGAVLGAVGLGGTVFALIEQAQYGWAHPFVYAPLFVGAISLILFIWHESRTAHPMLPLSLFKVRNFSVGNIATIAIYGGLAVGVFLITIFVQQVGGYSAFAAGMALLPVTIIMFLLSARFGALAARYGPRFFMTSGPIIAGLGFLWMLTVDETVAYWPQLLPGVLLFGLGLSVTVAPLTTAVLSAIRREEAGIGSAVNNAISRIAGLIAVAGIGLVVGTDLDVAGFHRGVVVMALLLIAGGIVSAAGIRNPKLREGE